MDETAKDPLEAMGDVPPARPTGKAKRRFDSPIERTTQRTAAAVQGKKKGYIWSGQYRQINFRLLPDVVGEIDEIAEELGVSKEETKRWLVDMGLRAWRRGIRPETEEKVRHITRKVLK